MLYDYWCVIICILSSYVYDGVVMLTTSFSNGAEQLLFSFCFAGVALHLLSDNARVAELGGPGLDIGVQILDGLVARNGGFEILELLASLCLDILADDNYAIQEFRDFNEILLIAATRCHCGASNSHTTGRKGGFVTSDAITVQGDVASFAHFLYLAARKLVGTDVPQDQMIVSSICHQLVAELHHRSAEGLGVLDNVLGVLGEFWGRDFLGLDGKAGNLVVVGTALKTGENGHVDCLLDWLTINLGALVVEDDTRARTSQRLVGGGGDDVGVLERRGMKIGRNQTGDMGHVHEEVGTDFVADGTELAEIDVARVGRGTGNDHLGAEKQCLLTKRVEIQ